LVRINAPDLEPGGPGVMVTVAAMGFLAGRRSGDDVRGCLVARKLLFGRRLQPQAAGQGLYALGSCQVRPIRLEHGNVGACLVG
jgi:hypothetical protein